MSLDPQTLPTLDLPADWTDEHTRFIEALAQQGEEPASIVILFEAEFPRIRLGGERELEDVVKKITAQGRP